MTIKNGLTGLTMAGIALTLLACSNPAEAPAETAPESAAVEGTEAAPTEAAPVAANTDADLPAEANPFLATLSPKELGMARLSCIEPLRTAQAWPKIWDAELAAELASVENFSRTKLLTKPPLNELSIAEARTIMDAGPQFNGHSTPSAEEITGVRQCIMLAKHYAAEQAAAGQ